MTECWSSCKTIYPKSFPPSPSRKKCLTLSRQIPEGFTYCSHSAKFVVLQNSGSSIIMWDLATGMDRRIDYHTCGRTNCRYDHFQPLRLDGGEFLAVTHHSANGEGSERLFRLSAPEVSVAEWPAEWPARDDVRYLLFGRHLFVVLAGDVVHAGELDSENHSPQTSGRFVHFPGGLWHPKRSSLRARDNRDGYFFHDWTTGVSQDIGFTKRTKVSARGTASLARAMLSPVLGFLLNEFIAMYAAA